MALECVPHPAAHWYPTIPTGPPQRHSVGIKDVIGERNKKVSNALSISANASPLPAALSWITGDFLFPSPFLKLSKSQLTELFQIYKMRIIISLAL